MSVRFFGPQFVLCRLSPPPYGLARLVPAGSNVASRKQVVGVSEVAEACGDDRFDDLADGVEERNGL